MKVLIIGQGLAGTLVGYRFEQGGHAVHYVNNPHYTAASEVAAGIVNPITGRRFVKSWRIDELLPELAETYTNLGKELGRTYWHPQALIRTLYNRGDVNDWQVRTADPGYRGYMDDAPEIGRIAQIAQPVFAYAGVRQAGRVNVRELVYDFWYSRQQETTNIAFNHAWVPMLLGDKPPDSSIPESLVGGFDLLIFCEGWRGRDNPYFHWAGHRGNKGEVLIIRTQEPLLDRIFKHRIFLVPLPERHAYWVGATSENQFTDDETSSTGYDFLKQRLDEVMTVPYEIIEHNAAVRPTVKDRRMVVGLHPQDNRLAILNGLGTKGASLAPMGAKWLFDLVATKKPIPDEVNVARFFEPDRK